MCHASRLSGEIKLERASASRRRCALSLELFKGTGQTAFRESAELLSGELLALQVKDGASLGLFREAAGKNTPGFGSCGYGMMLSGPSALTQLMAELTDSRLFDEWKTAAELYGRQLLKQYRDADRRYIPVVDVSVPLDQAPVIIRGNGVLRGTGDALFLLDSGLFPKEAGEVA